MAPDIRVSVDEDAGVGIDGSDYTLVVPADGASRGLKLGYSGRPTLQSPAPSENSRVRVEVSGGRAMGTVREVMVNGWVFVEYQLDSSSTRKVGWFEVSKLEVLDKSDPNSLLVSREADGA